MPRTRGGRELNNALINADIPLARQGARRSARANCPRENGRVSVPPLRESIADTAIFVPDYFVGAESMLRVPDIIPCWSIIVCIIICIMSMRFCIICICAPASAGLPF